MWQVDVTSSLPHGPFTRRFATEAEADAWIAEETARESFGKGDRWLRFDGVDEDGNYVAGSPDAGWTDSRFYDIPTSYIEDPANLGQEPPVMIVDTTTTGTEHFYPKEYTVTKTDITGQMEHQLGVEEAVRKMEHGKQVIALMVYRSRQKTLTDAESQTLVTTYSTIRALLQDGDLVTARALIDAEAVNAPIVTAEDKTALLAKIDEYGV